LYHHLLGGGSALFVFIVAKLEFGGTLRSQAPGGTKAFTLFQYSVKAFFKKNIFFIQL
jgi:hypothetical protein